MYLSKIKVAYMGTPEFAAEVLEELLSYEWLVIEAVITQPDRKVGRKRLLTASAVKEVALSKGLLILQPDKINDIFEDLKALGLEAIITCAYGQYIPNSILNMTPLGVINVHASLLPKYRGGAPMQHALIQGETVTGISLMRSAKIMDGGPVFSQYEVEIEAQDTLASLENKLIDAAKQHLQRDLKKILESEILAQPQDESLVSYAPIISRADEKIDFSKSAKQIYDHIRALNPIPLAYTKIDDKIVKFKTSIYQLNNHNYPVATIVSFDVSGLKIAVNGGFILVTELQVEGKQLNLARNIYNGYQDWIGKRCHD